MCHCSGYKQRRSEFWEDCDPGFTPPWSESIVLSYWMQLQVTRSRTNQHTFWSTKNWRCMCAIWNVREDGRRYLPLWCGKGEIEDNDKIPLVLNIHPKPPFLLPLPRSKIPPSLPPNTPSVNQTWLAGRSSNDCCKIFQHFPCDWWHRSVDSHDSNKVSPKMVGF